MALIIASVHLGKTWTANILLVVILLNTECNAMVFSDTCSVTDVGIRYVLIHH